MTSILDGWSGMAVFTGGAKVSELEKKLARMEARIAELEQRLARSETRFEMSVRFFEHRVDQIYARILPVLGRETGLFAGPNEPVAANGRSRNASEAADQFDWPADTSGGFIGPGRYTVPFSDAGFRLALGLAVERDGAVELQAGRRGAAMFGPYKKMIPGRYMVMWHLAPAASSGDGSKAEIGFDLYSPTADRVLAQTQLSGVISAPREVELLVAVPGDLANGLLELRVHQLGGCAVRLTDIEIQKS